MLKACQKSLIGGIPRHLLYLGHLMAEYITNRRNIALRVFLRDEPLHHVVNVHNSLGIIMHRNTTFYAL